MYSDRYFVFFHLGFVIGRWFKRTSPCQEIRDNNKFIINVDDLIEPEVVMID